MSISDKKPARYVYALFCSVLYPIIKIEESCGKISGGRNLYMFFLGTAHKYSVHEATVIKADKNNIFISQDRQVISYPISYVTTQPLVFTSYDEKKKASDTDLYRIEVAKTLGIINAERHSKYYENRPIPATFDPFPMGGRRIVLSSIIKKRAPTTDDLVLDINIDSFMIDTYLHRNTTDAVEAPSISTSFGTLTFETLA